MGGEVKYFIALTWDEASAYYAEAIFGTDAAIDLLLGEKQTLKQKILSFFTKSAAYYSTDEKLSKEARRHYKKFKAMFDAFTARNYGRNAETGLAGDKSARRYSAENTPKITADMTDKQRYEILKDRKLFNIKSVSELSPEMKKKIHELSSWDDINNYYGKNKKKIIKAIAREFGAIEKEYFNTDIELYFEFSNGNFNEAYKKQKHNFEAFAKMFSVFNDVVESAVGVEIHNNINHNYDPTLENVYVLMSAYQDGDELVPIKLEVKKFKDKQNTLYVAVSMEKIKMTELYARGNTDNGVTQLTRSVNISIANIFSKINPSDKSFLKYIPDNFLNKEQMKAKQDAIKEANDSDYKSAVERGDMVTAQRMVDEAAKKAGYDSPKVYHATDADFTVFGKIKTQPGYWFTESKEYASQHGDKTKAFYLKASRIVDDSNIWDYAEKYFGADVTENQIFSSDFRKNLEKEGFEGIVFDHSEALTYIVFSPDQIKSADPVTYDDEGNVIPLSERFNPKKSDIRYSSETIENVGKSRFDEPEMIGLPRKAGTMSVGQYKQRVANLTKTKSYAKNQAYDIVKNLPMADMASEKTREQITEAVWQIYNEQMTASERQEAARDISLFLVARLMTEAKVDNPEIVQANKEMAYLRTGIGRLSFTPEDISEFYVASIMIEKLR